MKISLFTSWQVRCGIADYGAHLVDGLQQIPDTQIMVVPFDRQVSESAFSPRRELTARLIAAFLCVLKADR